VHADPPVTVELGVDPPNEPATNGGMLTLLITVERDVPDEWVDVLAGIAAGRWPDGFQIGVPNQSLYNYYPRGLQELCDDVVETWRHFGRTAFGLIRWRFAEESWSGMRQLYSRADEWSADQST
jgi:hypothetical protein